MTDKIKIVAAILDTTVLTLYKEDGSTVELKQGDPRVAQIVQAVQGPLIDQGFAMVDLNMIEENNSYREFQEKTGGGIKFFRVAKKWLKDVFGGGETEKGDHWHEHLAPFSMGSVPALETNPNQIVEGTQNAKMSMEDATKQIMANAVPATDNNFNGGSVDHNDDAREDTIIAEVTDLKTGTKTLVPGMENISAQLTAACKLGSTKGAEAFIRRCAAVAQEKGHTVDELLRFMNRGDLPIADDGSILAYKSLFKNGNNGYYVDPHSRKVRQRCGSYVTQLKFDESRRTECSQGLHIARRGYLHGFSGDAIVLVKVAPEDVIAVPLGEPNKMRAKGYHLISAVNDEDYRELKSNRPVKSTDGKKALQLAISGQHIAIIEDVIIAGSYGEGVMVQPRATNDGAYRKVVKPSAKTPEASPIQTDKNALDAPAVDAKAIADTVTSAKTAAPAPTPKLVPVAGKMKPASSVNTGVTEQRKLFNDKNWTALYALKKAKKKGWDKLGFTDAETLVIVDNDPSKVSTQTVTKPNKAPEPVKVQQVKSAPAPKKAAKPAPAPKTEVPPLATPANSGVETRQEKARRLFKAKNWPELFAHKSKSKIGWNALGFTAAEEAAIVKNKK